MFPPIAIVIPLLIMYSYLELVDTYWGLILIYGAVTFPFVVWLMRSFFQVPREIAEAAIVDGCSQWGAFFKAVLPQVRGASRRPRSSCSSSTGATSCSRSC